jgi:hypothetical protein
VGDELVQLRLVEGFWLFWGGDLVAKLADEQFVAKARATEALIGGDWEFVADEGTQALGMTSGHRGIEGFLSIWRRWTEAFRSWEGHLVGTPILLERERVLARIDVRAESHAGVAIEFQTGILYSFDGSDLRRIVSFRTWEEALAGASVTAAEIEVLERESARVKELG